MIKENFYLLDKLKQIKILNFSIFPSIFFLPNFHFWFAGVGKDTLLFFCVCSFIYVLGNIKRRWLFLLFTIPFSYFIRPHVLLIFLGAFGASFILKSRMYAFQKVVIILLGIVLISPMLASTLEFAQIEDASLDSYDKFSSKQGKALANHAGSAVDLAGLPYPCLLYTSPSPRD